MASVIFALVLLLAVKYRISFKGVLAPLEVAVGALLFWELARLLILGPLGGERPAFYDAFREAGTMLAGLVLFRIARRPELRPVILRGLTIGFVAMLGMVAYQLAAGLPALVAHGYTQENGYNYATVRGSYRPFGFFRSPTIFGGYLAVAGLFVVTAAKGRTRVLFLIGLIAALVVTETRAAVLGVLFGGAVTYSRLGTRDRGRVILAGVLLAPLGAAVVILRPSLISGVWGRLVSAASSTDTSRSTRTEMWSGVISAVRDNNSIDGYGAAPWNETMNHYIGGLAALGNSHSNFFQQLYSYGLVGLLLFVIVLVVLFAEASRGQRRGQVYAAGAMGSVAVFLADSIFDNSLSSFNMLVTVLLLVGLGAHPRARDGMVPRGATGVELAARDSARGLSSTPKR